MIFIILSEVSGQVTRLGHRVYNEDGAFSVDFVDPAGFSQAVLTCPIT